MSRLRFGFGFLPEDDLLQEFVIVAASFFGIVRLDASFGVKVVYRAEPLEGGLGIFKLPSRSVNQFGQEKIPEHRVQRLASPRRD